MTRSGRIRAPITRLCLPERQNATVQYFSSILLPEKKIFLFNNTRGKVQKLAFSIFHRQELHHSALWNFYTWQHKVLTRLTYNCAHLRSTKESDSVKKKFVRKSFCVKIFLGENLLGEHFLSEHFFWVKIFLSENFGWNFCGWYFFGWTLFWVKMFGWKFFW